MYRNSGENPNDNLPSFLGRSGGGGYNYRGRNHPDMYLETSTLHSGTPTSSLATSPPTTPMTPDPLQFGYPSDFPSNQQEQHTNRFFNINSLLNNSINSIIGANRDGGLPINNLGPVGTMPQSNLMQQQQQQQQQLQQQQYYTMLQHNQLAQRKLSMSNIAANASGCTSGGGGNYPFLHQQHQQQDEISNSLKMYAMFTAYKDGIENNSGQVDIMQDFASNGYTTDDVYLQQYQTVTRSPLSSSAANIGQNINYFAFAAAQRQQQMLLNLQTQNWINHNFPESQNLINIDQQMQQQQQQQQQNMWLNTTLLPQLPTPLSPAAAPPQAAVTCNTSGGSSNLSDANMSNISASGGSANSSGGAVPKSTKRQMKDKYASMKHCVFCENNNEPEEVTKSHSVRDAMGRVLCPKLRVYICPICKASGDNAHTVKYCPKKPIITMEDAIKAQSYRLTKHGYNNKQMKV